MLGEDRIPFEQVVGEKNINRTLTEQEMDEAEINTTDLDAIV